MFLLCKELSLLLGPTPRRQQGNHLLKFLLCSLKGRMFLGLFLPFADFDTGWSEADSLCSAICPVPVSEPPPRPLAVTEARGVSVRSPAVSQVERKELKDLDKPQLLVGRRMQMSHISLFHGGSVLSRAPRRVPARVACAGCSRDARALSKGQECLDLGLQHQTSLPGSGVWRFPKIREN